MAKKKAKEVTEKVKIITYSGPTKSFRFKNPPEHPDKYNWITLQDGDEVPEVVIPELKEKERKTKIEERIKEIEEDLKDDGKRNFSTGKKKKTSSRSKKSKKNKRDY